MKNSLIMAVLCMIIACAKPTPPPPPPAPVVDTVGENNKALIERYTDAVVKGDTVAMASFLADNFKGYGPGLTDSTDRAKDIAGWSKSWKEEFASIDFKRVGMNAFSVADGRYAGDWVADWAVITVTYKNGYKPVTFWWHGVSRIKDGKIELSRSFFNLNDFFTQQGFKVTPPEAPKKKSK